MEHLYLTLAILGGTVGALTFVWKVMVQPCHKRIDRMREDFNERLDANAQADKEREGKFMTNEMCVLKHKSMVVQLKDLKTTATKTSDGVQQLLVRLAKLNGGV